MSTSILSISRSTWIGKVSDFIELTKPRISVLVLVTVAVAQYVAFVSHPIAGINRLVLMLHTLLGTLLVAASASALNQWLEREQDAQMPRTAGRPIPAGRLRAFEVLLFAVLTIIAGTVYLGLLVNWLAASWGLVTWFLYVWIYTPLKRNTAWNTAIGAVAGATPVFIGWTGSGAPLTLHALALFLILFVWQFPHFMAIAWIYRQQYDQAGIKMLTVVDPSGSRAGRQAVVGAIMLLPISLLPVIAILMQQTPSTGLITYAVAAVVLGLMQLTAAYRFNKYLDERSARSLLRASLVYLPILFAMQATSTSLL